jgi:hypothetical protein
VRFSVIDRFDGHVWYIYVFNGVLLAKQWRWHMEFDLWWFDLMHNVLNFMLKMSIWKLI